MITSPVVGGDAILACQGPEFVGGHPFLLNVLSIMSDVSNKKPRRNEQCNQR